tara:strand:+ start:2779 stop:4470 length:1692 start_codon:yes stop_codon:yes gene_type:complete
MKTHGRIGWVVNKMPANNPPLPPPVGEYRLFDRVLGPLKAGKYKLEIEQKIGTEEGKVSRFFNVTGPRWGLEAAEVHAVYPPRNEQDAPTNSHIPFITLQRRSLPWERDLFLSNETVQQFVNDNQMTTDARKYPWMALLILTEDELTNGGEVGVYKGDEGLCLVDSKNSIPGVFAHWSQTKRDSFDITSSMNGLTVDAIRVKTSTLRSVAPTLEEVLLLAHARQVNPQDKEQCGSDEDGWFAVILGNRVLKPDQKYHACLVSLEGRLSENILPTNPALVQTAPKTANPSKTTSMMMAGFGLPSMKEKTPEKGGGVGVSGPSPPSFTNLVLLHHWTFNSSQTNGDFQSRMERLNVRVESSRRSNVKAGDVIPLSEIDVARDTIEPMLLGTDSVPGVTANSYLSTTMHGSDGLEEDVLYRSPLVAYSEQRVVRDEPYPNSDAALAVIEELGIWDISHASAFELGRLLALGDGKFTKAMKAWVANDIKEEQRAEVEAKIEAKGFSVSKLNERLQSIKQHSSVRKVRDSRIDTSRHKAPQESKTTESINLETEYAGQAQEGGGSFGR